MRRERRNQEENITDSSEETAGEEREMSRELRPP